MARRKPSPKAAKATGDRRPVTVSQDFMDGITRLLEDAPRWIDEAQTATVLKTVAVFEDVVRQCLESVMRPMTKAMEARLFQGYGPLSSFAAKCDLAFALDLLSESDYADLQVIRKIRNRFAHAQEIMGFEKPEIASLVSKMARPKQEASWAYDRYFKRLHDIGLNLIAATAKQDGPRGRTVISRKR